MREMRSWFLPNLGKRFLSCLDCKPLRSPNKFKQF